MSGQWVRDGHTARVVLDIDMLRVELECPNTGDYSAVDPEFVPDCRKSWDEAGQLDPADTPLRYCNYSEWAYNAGHAIDSLDTDEIADTAPWLINGSFPIAWRWDGDTYWWVPSALLNNPAGGSA